MAAWWLTEAVPPPVTALLPVLLFPVGGVLSAREVSRSYGDPVIFLFLGGFVLAAAVQKWGLHRRIARRIILAFGVDPSRVLLGFMVATALLSMWISNTATAMLMAPIGLSVSHLPGGMSRSGSAAALMLGIAYAASIGGLATVVGSPPNAILVAYAQAHLQETLTFLAWMLYGLPVAAVGLLLTWLYLRRPLLSGAARRPGSLPAGGHALIADELARLGPMGHEERSVALVFAAVAVLWIVRGVAAPQLAGMGLGRVGDTGIALLGALALFALPARDGSGRALVAWEDVERIPWGVLLLFGGGLALARGIEESGAAAWAAGQLTALAGLPPLLVTGAVVAVVIFLTEVTSNTSTATLFMPVTASLAAGLGMAPDPLMVGAASAASCAFMLPVATPPNAIVFASGHVSLQEMARAGIWLNLAFTVLITLAASWWLPRAWSLV